jgi:hypothetical protein
MFKVFPVITFHSPNRYLEGLPSEYDHLQTKFKPLIPKEPRPQLLQRHVYENLPKAAADATFGGMNFEQFKRGIFECMIALIDKQVLSVQVRRRIIIFSFC